MRRRFLGAGLLAPFLLGVAGCASIVSDDDTTTYIATEPEGARCELVGDDDFKRVLVAPGSLSLPSDAAPIAVSCEADGYLRADAELDTSMDGWIIGNIIFGGVIGVVIDAARGAGMRYPPEITLILDPESFESAAARDEWFDGRRAALDEKWEAAVQDFTNRCQRSRTVECEPTLGKLNEQWEVETGELEARRAAAAVVEES